IPEDNSIPGADYSMPYKFRIGPMQGDWYDACIYYRDWALGNIVFRKPIEDPNTDFPPALLDIDGLCGCGLDNDGVGLTPEIIQGMKDDKAFYGIDKVANVLYKWVNEEGTAHGWPDITPNPTILDGVQAIQDDGDLVLAYVQIAYDKTLASFITNNIEDYAMKNIDGTLQGVADIVDIDPSTTYWQDFSRDWVTDKTTELGWDGMFWDYWTGFNQPCYNSAHGHPLGGGDYYIQGKLTQAENTLNQVRQLPGKESWFICSEFVNEFFIDVNAVEMWNFEIWDETLGQMPYVRLPMYETIFGERQYIWALPQTWEINDPDMNNLRSYFYASCMSVGMMLGFVSGTRETSTYGLESFQFLSKLLSSYEYTRKYLLWGRRMRDVQVNSVNSMSYYDLHSPYSIADISNHWIYSSSYPNVSYVLPSVWKSTQDGDSTLALVLINWFETQQTIDFTFKFDDYGLKHRSYYLIERDENGPTILGVVMEDFNRVETLDARSIKVIEITPRSPKFKRYMELGVKMKPFPQ
ncbi:MAG: hypothetical protein KJ645_12120, partial [Planctomycetes bacterium]|nr:hypothetical protein [Planctomycetota bacterium]